ncbi:hypothetical protein Hamer_G020937 [Homarus americanus]|uniref:Uncharacterized protein n=1 Tax=Homarus americanus TaxID=6706 RepID=A0A8J5K7V2_HOMAM|nr:hypothetical protein Hamer_G020937 [Homarus americanus]
MQTTTLAAHKPLIEELMSFAISTKDYVVVSFITPKLSIWIHLCNFFIMFHNGGDMYTILPTTIKPRRLQPGKRTVLVSILLSLLLLISQVMRALQLDQPPRLTNVNVMQESGSISCKSPPQCANLNHYIGAFSEEEAKIKWTQIVQNKLKRRVESHINQEKYFGFIFIKCSNTSEQLKDLGQPQYDENSANDYFESYTQLFLYPRKFKKFTQDPKVNRPNVNINLVMIDSLSRPHFYRSLPNTVELFEGLYEGAHPRVFDFQFFQAVKQRTYENFQALFSGYVNSTEIPFGTYDIPRNPLPVSQLFSLYKKSGYRTLWLEDLCWNWEWGLIKDLKVMNETLYGPALWQKFKRALAVANIDDIDLTLASCDILNSNGKKDPFHDLPAVCFNGRHHHDYMLEYVQIYQESIQKSGQPFLTLTVTDVAHDETGLRVQTLDEPLAKYSKFAVGLKNTITILFSDHGSTYGKFIQSSPEAHVETFNPFFFMIVPKDVQNLLGDVQMRILRDNERRLVSMIDVHNMLMQLLGEKSKVDDKDFVERYVTPGGLLSSISPTRTCNDIPLLQPNLCICQNFETSVEPSHIHMALADFGLGVLNNEILKQHREEGSIGFGNCRPLRAIHLRKVLETHISVELIRYKLDVVVQSAQEKGDENNDLFFLTLEVGSKKAALRLLSYERMNMYSVYNVCQDKSVELKLCICNIKNQNQNAGLLSSLLFGNLIPEFNFFQRDANLNSNIQMIDFLTVPLLGIKPKIDIAYPSQNPCLFTVIHNYKSGITLLAANFCSALHEVEIMMEVNNLNLSCPKHSKFLLHSGDVKMLFGGTVANPKVAWQWSHDIRIL